jgi:hypothetical protein
MARQIEAIQTRVNVDSHAAEHMLKRRRLELQGGLLRFASP